ncbi:hypothetical protein CRG98_033028 [Punica granatum]|nr:hypothetical protein CRG98_033028 [Punica granatum]
MERRSLLHTQAPLFPLQIPPNIFKSSQLEATASMGSSAIHIREAVVVTPSEPTPSTILPLSALDSQPFLRFTIEYLLIFKPPHRQAGSHQALISACLKSALAQALVPYYPLAGRVRPSPQGTLLEVVCQAQGAVFIEAASDHVAANFEWAPRHITQWRRLLSLCVPDVLQGGPSLVVQLTWLRDGNAALGVGFNHCLIDGIGSGEFLNSFAELARRQELGGRGELTPKPVWDRHYVDSICPHETSREYSGASAAAGEFSQVLDISGLNSRFSSERLVPTAVVFDRTSLNELKKAASSTSMYTSFEVLSAHVWRSWARSLNLPSNQVLKLVFSTNIRNRVEPGIPNGYYGNAFVLARLQSTARDLTEKGLGHVTRLVKRAKDRVGPEYVRAIIDSVREGRVEADLTSTLVISQWSTLGLDRVDFGMGRPVHIAPICCDRYCLILPRTGGRQDGVKVMVAVPASAVDKYERLVKNTSCS